MKISLNTISPKRKPYFKIFQYLFLFSIVAFFTSIVLTDNKTVFLSFGAIAFISGAFITFLQEHNISGRILLSKDLIVIDDFSKKEKTYNINSLKKITIIYCEYEGGNYPNSNSIGLTKGLNNYIIIEKTNASNEKIEVLLQKNNIPKINQITNEWREKSIDVILTNEWGKNVKKFTC
ncbi:MAG: hypothetical protein P8I82_02120 [Flavobacteriales bacterium]|nr:hypothetical protein [Flavobacteriales bacterium]